VVEGKPLGSKKPCKQYGDRKGLAYITVMLEANQKGQKRACKSKKHKKCTSTLVVILTVNRNQGAVTRGYVETSVLK
jgi:hypothetical protein